MLSRRSVVTFISIGVAIYCVLFFGSEGLVYKNGHSNPIFKIVTTDEKKLDWVILGASHAMTLSFDEFNSKMESDTGLKILNLSAPGAGPLYQKFALERFLKGHQTTNILYVVDSFAFQSRVWNEDRFVDSKLLSRTPLDVAAVSLLANYSYREGIDPRALIDYVTGFSKLNNPARFETDVFEGEAQFDRTFRPSNAADAKRIEYLYAHSGSQNASTARYLRELEKIVKLAHGNGANITLIKMPVPSPFYRKLPNESDFDAAISTLAANMSVPFWDFSSTLDGAEHYSDTDHLNRKGVMTFYENNLRAILMRASDSR
jgi:hypothetical protein